MSGATRVKTRRGSGTHEVYLPLENLNGHPILRIMKPTAP